MGGEPADDQLQLRFVSDPRLLCVARASVRRFVELAGFEGRQAEDLVLAVDEALTNVIRHGYGGRKDMPIELLLGLEEGEPGRVLFCVRDSGPKLSPEQLEPPTEKDLEKPGGLGLRLIHEVMDSVELRDGPAGGNELRMGASLPSP